MSTSMSEILINAVLETLYMVVLTGVFAFFFGFMFGILLVVTDEGGISPNRIFNRTFGGIINIIRSFPSMILIVVLLPLSRLIVGTALGETAAVVPLVILTSCFISRVVESSLKEVDKGKIEASISMGATTKQIIFQVIIPESLPSLVRGITLSVITIIGATAIAGVVGAGGLGSIALRYGYQRFQDEYIVATVIILIIFVQGIQLLGDYIVKKINIRRHSS